MTDEREDVKIRNLFSPDTSADKWRARGGGDIPSCSQTPREGLSHGGWLTCGCSSGQSSEAGGWLLTADGRSGDKPHPPAIPRSGTVGGGAQLFLLTTSASKSRTLVHTHKTPIF